MTICLNLCKEKLLGAIFFALAQMWLLFAEANGLFHILPTFVKAIFLALAHCQWGSKPESHLPKLTEMWHFQPSPSCPEEHTCTNFGANWSVNGGGDPGQTYGQQIQIIVWWHVTEQSYVLYVVGWRLPADCSPNNGSIAMPWGWNVAGDPSYWHMTIFSLLRK